MSQESSTRRIFLAQGQLKIRIDCPPPTVAYSSMKKHILSFSNGPELNKETNENYRENYELKQKYKVIGLELKDQVENSYKNGEFPKAAWETFSLAGFWKIPVPKEYGGMGGDWWDFVSAFEGLAEGIMDIGIMLSGIAHVGCMRVVLKYGSEYQKNTFLRQLSEGKIGATAITEESGGSDVSRLKTSAVRQRDQYVLNGLKAHITNGPIFDICMVTGRIPELGDKKDITLFLVSRDAEGISTAAAENMLGNKSSPTGNINLQNVIIGEENILGKPGTGLSLLYDLIALDRALYGVLGSSVSHAVLKKCIHFSQQRTAFKKAIIDHQYIQKRITDIKILQSTTACISRYALENLFSETEEAPMFSSIAKLVGSESLYKIADHYMRIHGHYGYEQNEIGRFLMDAVGTVIAGGTSEIQRVNIFNQLVKLDAKHA